MQLHMSLRDELPIVLDWFCLDLFCLGVWAAMYVALTGGI